MHGAQLLGEAGGKRGQGLQWCEFVERQRTCPSLHLLARGISTQNQEIGRFTGLGKTGKHPKPDHSILPVLPRPVSGGRGVFELPSFSPTQGELLPLWTISISAIRARMPPIGDSRDASLAHRYRIWPCGYEGPQNGCRLIARLGPCDWYILSRWA